MSSSYLAQGIIRNILEELYDQRGIGNELAIMRDDVRNDLIKSLEDIVDNQIENAMEE